MNIEEERKAFEDLCSSILPSVRSAKWNGEKYVSNFSSAKPYLQATFEVWLKAKAHVAAEAEALKPTVKIQRLIGDYNYPWVLVKYKGEKAIGRLDYFVSVADAKVWAQTNGYRVIE